VSDIKTECIHYALTAIILQRARKVWWCVLMCMPFYRSTFERELQILHQQRVPASVGRECRTWISIIRNVQDRRHRERNSMLED